MAVKKKARGKGKDPKKLKPRKKKVSPLVKESIEYVDYKDVTLLRAFMSDRAKIRARRVSGNDVQQQREITVAIKNAREMALLPYASRIVTQRKGDKRRGGRDRDDRGDRGDRGERNEGDEAPAEDTESEVVEATAGAEGGEE